MKSEHLADNKLLSPFAEFDYIAQPALESNRRRCKPRRTHIMAWHGSKAKRFDFAFILRKLE